MKATDFSSLYSAQLRFLAVMLFLLMASASYSQTVIYRETFGASGAQSNLAAQGITDWTETYTMTGNSAVADNNLYINASMGSTSYVNVAPATGTASTAVQKSNGIYRTQSKYNANTAALSLYSTSLTLDPTAHSYTFEWYQLNQTAGSNVHLLLQVGGSWYVGATSLVTTPNTVALESVTYNTTATNWLLLSSGANPVNNGVTNYNGDFLLTTPAPSNLSGNITAFGLLMVNGAGTPGTLSIDNFSVYEAVPEPSSITLVACSMAGFAWLGLRRKRN